MSKIQGKSLFIFLKSIDILGRRLKKIKKKTFFLQKKKLNGSQRIYTSDIFKHTNGEL